MLWTLLRSRSTPMTRCPSSARQAAVTHPTYPSPKTVAVVGLGYVGCVTAACLAELGHRVIGVDRDRSKVHSILEGRAPFYEPGLEELVGAGVEAGLLRATTSAEEAFADADVAMVCVGTPSERNGNLGLDQL